MLILSRKNGESIVIQDNITIKVLSVDGDTVKLGIEAPKQISIFRSEIFEEIRSENKGSIVKNFDLDLKELATLLNDTTEKK